MSFTDHHVESSSLSRVCITRRQQWGVVPKAELLLGGGAVRGGDPSMPATARGLLP